MPPFPSDTHLLSMCDALMQLDTLPRRPQSLGSPAPALWPPPKAVARDLWAKGAVGLSWGGSGSLDHHLELGWKRRAGFSLRLGSEGERQKARKQLRPWPTAWVTLLVKGGDAPAHLTYIPGLCDEGHEGQTQAAGEGPGTGSWDMYCSGSNHLGPSCPPWVPAEGKPPGGGRGE